MKQVIEGRRHQLGHNKDILGGLKTGAHEEQHVGVADLPANATKKGWIGDQEGRKETKESGGNQ